MENIIILLVTLIFGLGIIVFSLLKKKDGDARGGDSEKLTAMIERMAMLAEQNKELRDMMDNKLAETHKTTQEHFGKTSGIMNSITQQTQKAMSDVHNQSQKMIAAVTERLTKLDETNKQVVNFSAQLQNLQDILKNPKQRGVLGEYYLEETLKNAEVFRTLGVEFIEQPMPAENWDDAKIVYEKSVLPIIADESCQIESDVLKCVGHFHGINIKLAKCGGLTPARRMLFEAEKLGLKKMVGCMTESTVGMSAIAHLLPYLDYVDMDGQLLMKYAIAEGTSLDFGKIIYAKGIGTGVELKNISPKTEIK